MPIADPRPRRRAARRLPGARPLRAALPPRARLALRRLAADERGSLMVLSVFIFIAMLVTSALTFDLLRQEETRMRVQFAADSAALAAADLSGTLDPHEVVADYLTKQGLDPSDFTVEIPTNRYGVTTYVDVQANTAIKRSFSQILAPSVPEFPVNVHARAEESVSKVEVSLVLDVSGSMAEVVGSSGQTRLQRLKPAAKTFITKMFTNIQPAGAEPGRLMMSIVPYSTQVTLPAAMAGVYSFTNDYTIVNSAYALQNCADFEEADFASTDILPGAALTRTMLGDSFYNSNASRGTHAYENCPSRAVNFLMPYEESQTRLLAKVDGLVSDGWTSINIGAKWGLGLLSPRSRPALNAMIDGGAVSTSFRDRPSDYGATGDALKVMVLMTDGANTINYSTKAAYRSGPSPIRSTAGASTFYETRYDSNGRAYQAPTYYYYSAARAAAGQAPYYDYSVPQWVQASAVKTYENYAGMCLQGSKWKACTLTRQTTTPATFTPVAYDQLYQNAATGWNLWHVASLFAPPNGRSTTEQYNLMANRYENGTAYSADAKDRMLEKVCNAARNLGVLVFTIAVDAADTYDSSVLTRCATSAAYAYSIDSANLATAFDEIEANIGALRLSH